MSRYTLDPENKISSAEAASLLGIKTPTLAQWRFYRKSPVTPYKIGFRYFYHKQEILDYMANSATPELTRLQTA